MFSSSNRPCRFLLVERVYDNNKTYFTKLKKVDSTSFSEVMQFDKEESLETISGQMDQKVFHLEGSTRWFSFDNKWKLNDGQFRIGVSRAF